MGGTGMRRRTRVPVITATLIMLVLGGCASTGHETAQPARAARPVVGTVPVPTRQNDRVLILANRDGAVSVRTATGAVAFRAPFGVSAPDSSTVVQAQPLDHGTRIVASDALTGVARWSHDVGATRRVRVVSPGGRFVALVDGDLNVSSQPRTSTVIDVVTAKGARELRVRGNLDPEAFSVDGRSLYALVFLPATNPTRYSVRRIDLATGRVTPVPDRNGAVRDPMPGYAQSQVMSPDGRQLYTFYASGEPIHEGHETYHAWIHVLNLAHGWAHCVELDEKIGVSGTANAAVAVSPDGSRLFVTDGVTHALVAIDTKTLRVLRTRFLPTLADQAALIATDGHTVYAHNNEGGLATIDARTLAPDSLTISGVGGIDALRVDSSGEALYLLTPGALLVVDRRGLVVRRWPAPGDATSIDPSVTVPGAGAYRCAC
jgi:outer membrane protein assembly factor BamB